MSERELWAAVLSVDYIGDLDDKLLATLYDARRRIRASLRPRFEPAYSDARQSYDFTLWQLGLRHGWELDPPPDDGAQLSFDARRDLEEYLVDRGLDVHGGGEDDDDA